MFVTIGKEAYDDYKRYKRDQEANSQLYERLTESGFVYIPSMDIKVGDFIRIQRNQRVPADCILLRTTEKSGACFIRTDQLDGETDWKMRVALPFSQNLESHLLLTSLSLNIYAERASKDIYSFAGNLTWRGLMGRAVEAASIENTMWANTVVASGDAIGVVVYTGKDVSRY